MLSYYRTSNGLGVLPAATVAKVVYDKDGNASSADPGVDAFFRAVQTSLNAAATAVQLIPGKVDGIIGPNTASLAFAVADAALAAKLPVGDHAALFQGLVDAMKSGSKAAIAYIVTNADKLDDAFLAAQQGFAAAPSPAKSKTGVYLTWGAVILLVAAGSVGGYYLVRRYRRRQPELAPASA